MQLNQDSSSGLMIKAYKDKDRTIQVGETWYDKSFFMTNTHIEVIEPKEMVLSTIPNCCETLIAMHARIIAIGFTPEKIELSTNIQHFFWERDIPTEIMNIGSACRTYNVLVSEQRHPGAIFLL